VHLPFGFVLRTVRSHAFKEMNYFQLSLVVESKKRRLPFSMHDVAAAAVAVFSAAAATFDSFYKPLPTVVV